MKILATADLHGNLPDIPDCDLLLIGGDILPLAIQHDNARSLQWLDYEFREWLRHIPPAKIIGIAGNHDFVFETGWVDSLLLPWTYLQDTGTIYNGLYIWG